MSASGATTNYNLSQFISTDIPSWLGDYNGDMLKIDTGINGAKLAADSAALAASAAQNDASTALSNVGTLSTTVGTLSNTVGTAVGNINTINSLIGNGVPTTTDQTIIGAINELHADQGDLTNLTTTDKTSLVAAINEVAGGGSSLPYDEILSISAGQYTSYGAALAPIETAYDALTNEEKIHSAILVGDYLARVTNTVSKYFCASYGASGNIYGSDIFGSECFDLVNHNYTKGAIVGTVASTSDNSSDPQTLPMKLVVI